MSKRRPRKMKCRCMPLYCHLIYLTAFAVLSYLNLATQFCCQLHEQLHSYRSKPFGEILKAADFNPMLLWHSPKEGSHFHHTRQKYLSALSKRNITSSDQDQKATSSPEIIAHNVIAADSDDYRSDETDSEEASVVQVIENLIDIQKDGPTEASQTVKKTKTKRGSSTHKEKHESKRRQKKSESVNPDESQQNVLLEISDSILQSLTPPKEVKEPVHEQPNGKEETMHEQHKVDDKHTIDLPVDELGANSDKDATVVPDNDVDIGKESSIDSFESDETTQESLSSSLKEIAVSSKQEVTQQSGSGEQTHSVHISVEGLSASEKAEEEDTYDEDIDDPGANYTRSRQRYYTTFMSGDKLVVKLVAQVKNTNKKTFKVVGGQKFISLIRAWEYAGWTRKYDPVPVSEITLLVTKPITRVPGSRGKMISQISSSSCIGGTKGIQLRCREYFAAKHNCTFASLHISPAQYNMWNRDECLAFIVEASKKENQNKMWIGKQGNSYHGAHMSIFKGLPSSVKRKFGKCTYDKNVGAGYIMMDYISNPLLIDQHKFDLRTFLLVASTDPYMVFYHEGFIRRSVAEYSNKTSNKLAHITNHRNQPEENHFWGFQQLESYLHETHGFPEDFMREEFRKYAKHASNYVFQAARSRLKRRSGAFMLFALDWMIDEDRGIHLLEGNGNPTIRLYENTGLTPRIWRNMTQLVTLLLYEPDKITGNPTVADSFRFGGWELIFNEAEEEAKEIAYNPCKHSIYVQNEATVVSRSLNSTQKSRR